MVRLRQGGKRGAKCQSRGLRKARACYALVGPMLARLAALKVATQLSSVRASKPAIRSAVTAAAQVWPCPTASLGLPAVCAGAQLLTAAWTRAWCGTRFVG